METMPLLAAGRTSRLDEDPHERREDRPDTIASHRGRLDVSDPDSPEREKRDRGERHGDRGQLVPVPRRVRHRHAEPIGADEALGLRHGRDEAGDDGERVVQDLESDLSRLGSGV